MKDKLGLDIVGDVEENRQVPSFVNVYGVNVRRKVSKPSKHPIDVVDENGRKLRSVNSRIAPLPVARVSPAIDNGLKIQALKQKKGKIKPIKIVSEGMMTDAYKQMAIDRFNGLIKRIGDCVSSVERFYHWAPSSFSMFDSLDVLNKKADDFEKAVEKLENSVGTLRSHKKRTCGSIEEWWCSVTQPDYGKGSSVKRTFLKTVSKTRLLREIHKFADNERLEIPNRKALIMASDLLKSYDGKKSLEENLADAFLSIM